MSGKLVIAIDGPAGAGKSTVAKVVAQKLGLIYIDTGAMYRALTLKILQRGISTTDENAIAEVAGDTSIELQQIYDQDKRALLKVLLDGLDVTDKIREPEIAKNVSLVAKIPAVRERMVDLQRVMARKGNVVMDGRDIGTVVLPFADIKFFLTASVEQRATRRYDELKLGGYQVNFKEILDDIRQRDLMDSQREIAPLKVADDAEIIDTTSLSIDEVVEVIIEMCNEIVR